jgi:hypothetical protein
LGGRNYQSRWAEGLTQRLGSATDQLIFWSGQVRSVALFQTAWSGQVSFWSGQLVRFWSVGQFFVTYFYATNLYFIYFY